MRFGLGLVGLLVVLAVVAVLAKKEMAASHVALPAVVPGQAVSSSPPTGNVRQQSQQIEQQYKQQLDAAMQQQRPMPKDAE